MQRSIYLFLGLVGIVWMGFNIQPAGAIEDYWKPNCRVNKAAEKNVFIDEYGERVYFNVDRKVLWELANDFCIELDLLVAYNFILVPREPVQYAYIKLPPGRDELGWFPGQSLTRPSNYPLLAEEFLFEDTPPDQFMWPIENDLILVSQLYHNHHHGVDLDIEVGTPVSAMANGQVLRIEQDHHVYGKLIVVDHGNNIMALYAHLSDIQIKNNQRFKKGEQIALTGNSGRSTAPHLHIEIRESFRFTDPCGYLPECPQYAFHGPRLNKVVTTTKEKSTNKQEQKQNQSLNAPIQNSESSAPAKPTQQANEPEQPVVPVLGDTNDSGGAITTTTEDEAQDK